MTLVSRLARPAILELKAYKSARSLTTRGELFLDANESPWPAVESAQGFNRYPEPQPAILVEKLAALYGVTPAMLMVGRGADEAIDVLVRSFCEAGRDAILICPPTYGVYEVAAQIQGARVIRVPVRSEDGFRVNEAEILAGVDGTTKIVFLCRPNNPTGNLIPESTVFSLCEKLKDRALVVVDEAYLEFSSAPSVIPAISDFENLVVLRTLSKAWAMAGARCGVALARPELIALLQKVRAPYPMSAPAVHAILAGLGNVEGFHARVHRIQSERDRLAARLEKLSVVREIFPSAANYLLLRVSDSRAFLAACAAKGIIVRDRSSEIGLENCVRVTIGSPEENEKLLAALGAML